MPFVDPCVISLQICIHITTGRLSYINFMDAVTSLGTPVHLLINAIISQSCGSSAGASVYAHIMGNKCDLSDFLHSHHQLSREEPPPPPLTSFYLHQLYTGLILLNAASAKYSFTCFNHQHAFKCRQEDSDEPVAEKKFCLHPQWLMRCPNCRGTKTCL